MKLTRSPLFLMIYLTLSIFFMESVLRVIVFKSFFNPDLLFSFLFSIFYGYLFFLLCSFHKNKTTNHILSIILLGIMALIFSSQLLYFRSFKTFFTLYSASNAGQVAEFWKDILLLSLKHGLPIFLFFIPLILLALFGKKRFSFSKISWNHRIILLCCMMIVQAISIITIYCNGKEQFSAYDLYFKNSDPILSVERFGMLTNMRLDLQRILTGWSPDLQGPQQHLASPDSNQKEVRKNEDAKEYNKLPINFDRLILEETDDSLKNMHKYFQSNPATAKNKYTGKYKGYNLIFITAESFSPYAVRKDVTPTLYKMVHEGFHFKNFYNPIWGVSTTDGEYVATTGLIPKKDVWSFYKSGDNYLPFVMGNQLKKLGYKTKAYHNHTYTYYKRHISHPNMGYAYKAVGNGLNLKLTWPESDLEMIKKTVSEYINHQPFHTYYMTVSGHMRYSFTGNYIAAKNKKYVKNLPYSEQAKAYIATQIELDLSLQYLLKKLEEEGVANNTLIALSADHYPYGLENNVINELAGHNVEENFELYKSPFILYTTNMDPVVIEKPASSLDIIPTLSNLLGLEFDSRLLMGRDIFSDSEPLVLFFNRSFITDKGRYNSLTREFIPNKDIKVNQEYINQMSSIVNNKFYYSARILETDYYRKVLK